MHFEKQQKFILIMVISIAMCFSFCINFFYVSNDGVRKGCQSSSLYVAQSIMQDNGSELVEEIQSDGTIGSFPLNINNEIHNSAKSRQFRNYLVSTYVLFFESHLS